MKRIIAALALVLTLALPGLAAAEGTGMYPVSYTHLTLPTICSV